MWRNAGKAVAAWWGCGWSVAAMVAVVVVAAAAAVVVAVVVWWMGGWRRRHLPAERWRVRPSSSSMHTSIETLVASSSKRISTLAVATTSSSAFPRARGAPPPPATQRAHLLVFDCAARCRGRRGRCPGRQVEASDAGKGSDAAPRPQLRRQRAPAPPPARAASSGQWAERCPSRGSPRGAAAPRRCRRTVAPRTNSSSRPTSSSASTPTARRAAAGLDKLGVASGAGRRRRWRFRPRR